jgi:Family of unknown function (DUF6491)
MRTGKWLAAGVLLWLTTPAVAADAPAEPVQSAPSGADGISPEALAILSEVLPADAYGEQSLCISMRRVSRVEVLDDAHLLFWMRGETWLNRLARPCRGLRQNSLLEFQQFGMQLCQHDSMLARERHDLRETDYPPRCRIGRFEKLDLQQAGMLQDQFRQMRKQRRGNGRSAPRETKEK